MYSKIDVSVSEMSETVVETNQSEPVVHHCFENGSLLVPIKLDTDNTTLTMADEV